MTEKSKSKSKKKEAKEVLLTEHQMRLTQVCEHIWAASGILKTFDSPELQRVAWLLEDSITYIYEAETMEVAQPIEKVVLDADDLVEDQASPLRS